MEESVLVFSASQTAYFQSSGENATPSRGISLLASYKFPPLYGLKIHSGKRMNPFVFAVVQASEIVKR